MGITAGPDGLIRELGGHVISVVADTPDGRCGSSRPAASCSPPPASRRPSPGAASSSRTDGAEHWSLALKTADGAGTSRGESVGGRLRTDLASPAAWCPVSLVPYRSGRTGTFSHIAPTYALTGNERARGPGPGAAFGRGRRRLLVRAAGGMVGAGTDAPSRNPSHREVQFLATG